MMNRLTILSLIFVLISLGCSQVIYELERDLTAGSWSLEVNCGSDSTDLIKCGFNLDDLFQQINYIESLDFISSKIESGYYKKCSVHWLYGYNDRIRYYNMTSYDSRTNYIDIFLINNQIRSAMEWRSEQGTVDRCVDKTFVCPYYQPPSVMFTPPCPLAESVVDRYILDNLENSSYITDLEDQGFELTRFSGPAFGCFNISNNYIHLNFEYHKGEFLYSLAINTECKICD